MTEFRQFLFVICIIVDVICIGIITSGKTDKDEHKSLGAFTLIMCILTTSYIVSYLL